MPIIECDYRHSTRGGRGYDSAFSLTQRDMAVTSFRGANRVDCAVSQFCIPLIASVRPSITAR